MQQARISAASTALRAARSRVRPATQTNHAEGFAGFVGFVHAQPEAHQACSPRGAERSECGSHRQCIGERSYWVVTVSTQSPACGAAWRGLARRGAVRRFHCTPAGSEAQRCLYFAVPAARLAFETLFQHQVSYCLFLFPSVLMVANNCRRAFTLFDMLPSRVNPALADRRFPRIARVGNRNQCRCHASTASRPAALPASAEANSTGLSSLQQLASASEPCRRALRCAAKGTAGARSDVLVLVRQSWEQPCI